MLPTRTLFQIGFSFIVALAAARAAHAADVTWVGPIDSFWDLPANWSPGLPGAADDALLGAFNTEFRTGNTAIRSFAGAGRLNATGGTLQVDQASTIGSLSMTSGSIGGTGNVTVTGSADFAFGDHRGSGTTTLKGASTISGTGFRLDGGRILRNESALNWTGGFIILNNTFSGTSGGAGSGTIDNTTGATFTASGDSARFISSSDFGAGDTGADAVFNNAGTFRKSGSSATSFTNINVRFNNTGTVDVQTGTVGLTKGSSHTGNFQFTGSGELRLGLGTHVFNAPTVIISGKLVLGTGEPVSLVNSVPMTLTGQGTFQQSFSSVEGADLTITCNAVFRDSDHHGPGTTTLQGPSILGGKRFSLDGGRVLRNENTLSLDSVVVNLNESRNGSLGRAGSGKIDNIAGATIISGGRYASHITASNLGAGDTGADAVVNNAGTFRTVDSSATTVTNVEVAFTNTGTVDVQTGTLRFTNTFMHTGTLMGAGIVEIGTLTNDGHVAPGNSPGTLTLRGNFVQTALGSLDVELQNRDSFDTLLVNGDATLGGTLALAAFGRCHFDVGEEIVILDATGQLSGRFAGVTMTGFTRGAFDVVCDTDQSRVLLRVTETAVPEPAAWALLLSGLGLAAAATRRGRGASR